MKDCECNSDHVNHYNDSVFEKSSYKEMSEISRDEYPVRRREAKKKNLQEKIFPLNVILGSVAAWHRGQGPTFRVDSQGSTLSLAVYFFVAQFFPRFVFVFF